MTALERLGELGVVPVVEIDDAALAPELGEALASAGLPAVELTFRTEAAAAAIAALRDSHPGLLLIAGTVTGAREVDEAREAGADLLVSPGLNPAVVEHAQGAGAPILPGVATPSEVELARSLGLSAVKVFPVELLGGPAYLRALSGPFGQMRWSPSGGVSAANLPAYLGLDSVLACGGSWIAPRAEIAARRFAAIGERAAAALELARSVRGGG
ncbi:MAG: bifunctional 4-hydroxy-2-oxoglutarate aldolase/2-dehydro-3-deoxy-phosphogluconate aldolase [Solirubrobacterales bacterium]